VEVVFWDNRSTDGSAAIRAATTIAFVLLAEQTTPLGPRGRWRSRRRAAS
jgi:hypothetical protein